MENEPNKTTQEPSVTKTSEAPIEQFNKENEPNKTTQESSSTNTSEALFEKLNKVIVSWFALMEWTVRTLTISLAIFAVIGIAFFGYNMWDVQKELKLGVQEVEKTRQEFEKKAAEVDRLKLETEDKLNGIVERYNKNFETVRRELVKKSNVKLSGEIVPYPSPPTPTPAPYTPPIKP